MIYFCIEFSLASEYVCIHTTQMLPKSLHSICMVVCSYSIHLTPVWQLNHRKPQSDGVSLHINHIIWSRMDFLRSSGVLAEAHYTTVLDIPIFCAPNSCHVCCDPTCWDFILVSDAGDHLLYSIANKKTKNSKLRHSADTARLWRLGRDHTTWQSPHVLSNLRVLKTVGISQEFELVARCRS